MTTQERELSRMKLVELKAMATELGLKGVSAMRKPQLIEALSAAQGGAPKQEEAPRSRRRRVAREEASEAPQVSIELPAPVLQSTVEERSSNDAGLPRKSRRRRVVSSEAAEPQTVTLDLPTPTRHEEEESAPAPAQHIEIALPDSDDPEARDRSRRDREGRRRGRGREGRRERGERNERVERGERRESAPVSEENLAPIAGILDVQENHAFVRTSGYLPGPNDVYVTLGNVRRWGAPAPEVQRAGSR